MSNAVSSTVLGLPINLSDDYCGWLIDCLQQNRGVHVVTLNAEMAMLAEQDQTVAAIIQQADLVIPDGAGVVLYLRMRGKRQKRCPGIELAAALIEAIAKIDPSTTICFYGGAPGVSAKAAAMWQQQIPQLQIVAQHGYLTQTQEQEWLESLQAQQPRLILVGLGVPRQEKWIVEHRHLFPHAVWIGVGGSFDIWSGNKSRAPAWLKDNSLEWLYRLYQEPWRWRRMLVLPQFFWRSLWAEK